MCSYIGTNVFQRTWSPLRIGVSSFAAGSIRSTTSWQRVLAIYFSKGSHTFSLYLAQPCSKARSTFQSNRQRFSIWFDLWRLEPLLRFFNLYIATYFSPNNEVQDSYWPFSCLKTSYKQSWYQFWKDVFLFFDILYIKFTHWPIILEDRI